jgi:hypothetical protein
MAKIEPRERPTEAAYRVSITICARMTKTARVLSRISVLM